MFKFTKIAPKIYHLEFNKQFDLCMCFMRYQETYESSRNIFRNKPFTIVEYMKWQSENLGSGKFTYPTAWIGFNLPFKIIGDVIERGITDPNMYDSLISSIYHQVNCIEDEDCYLIGSFPGDSALDHELTHAFYYTNLEYRQLVDETIFKFQKKNAQCKQLIENLSNRLISDGYRDDLYIILDELNAYITTGDNGYFTAYLKNKNYKQLKSELLKLWNKYYIV